MKCPNCGNDNVDGNTFCNQCGTRTISNAYSQTQTATQSATQSQCVGDFDDVKGTVVRRLDAIKNKDQNTIASLMDVCYSKFDDWPPYQRQERSQALEGEFAAFKVLSNYTYDLRDFQSMALNDTALATFIIHYRPSMRNQQFEVTSRVTAVLKRQGAGWKFIHEHFSRFPDNTQSQQVRQGRRRFPF